MVAKGGTRGSGRALETPQCHQEGLEIPNVS